MIPNNRTVWLTACLYYAEDLHGFLRDAVAPFVREVMGGGLARQFFFIRYWEKGTHIRLRFKGNETIMETVLKPDLSAFFEAYYKDKPSVRGRNFRLNQYSDASQWAPNNSVQFTLYEPETGRYGGPAGVEVAEQQFELSSRVALDILRLYPPDYQQLTGIAIQLQLALMYACGYTMEKVIKLSDTICLAWLPNAQAWLITAEHDSRYEHKENVLLLYASRFEQHRDLYVSYIGKLWNTLCSGQAFEEDWMNRWIGGMKKVTTQLHGLCAGGQLHVSADDQYSDEETIRAILESYIHMMNNRLGILNREESYIAYVIWRSMEENARLSEAGRL